MSHERIWILIIALSLATSFLRGSFIVFMANQNLPEVLGRYLRYVAVAIIPGMIAVLVAFPASEGGQTNITWLGASLIAILVGLRFKNSLIIMLTGAVAFLMLGYFL